MDVVWTNISEILFSYHDKGRRLLWLATLILVKSILATLNESAALIGATTLASYSSGARMRIEWMAPAQQLFDPSFLIFLYFHIERSSTPHGGDSFVETNSLANFSGHEQTGSFEIDEGFDLQKSLCTGPALPISNPDGSMIFIASM